VYFSKLSILKQVKKKVKSLKYQLNETARQLLSNIHQIPGSSVQGSVNGDNSINALHNGK